MKKGVFLALALLAGSMSANATTILVTLSLDSAYGSPGNVLLGINAVGNNIGINTNLTTGTNIGDGQTYQAINVIYKLSAAIDLGAGGADVTTAYKNGQYSITNVTNLDVSVLYRDDTFAAGAGGGDSETEGWSANITDGSFVIKQSGVAAQSPTTLSGFNDSLQNVALVDANIDSILESYIIANAGNDVIGVQLTTTDGDWRLRGLGGSLTLVAEADFTPEGDTPEPATMGIVGFGLLGAGLAVRRRSAK